MLIIYDIPLSTLAGDARFNHPVVIFPGACFRSCRWCFRCLKVSLDLDPRLWVIDFSCSAQPFIGMFERKVQHTFAIFLVTLISIVLLSVLMYVTGNDLLFFWLVSLIILNFFFLLTPSKLSLGIDLPSISAILFSIAVLIALIFFSPLLSKLPSEFAYLFLGLPAGSIISGTLAWILRKNKAAHQGLLVISAILVFLFLILFSFISFDLISIFLVTLSVLFILFCSRIDSSKKPFIEFKSHWTLIFSFWIVLLYAIVTAVASFVSLLSSLQSVNHLLFESLSVLLVLIMEIIILCAGLFVETNQSRMEEQLSSLSGNIPSDQPTALIKPSNFYSSPGLSSLIQSRMSLQEKTRSLANLREISRPRQNPALKNNCALEFPALPDFRKNWNIHWTCQYHPSTWFLLCRKHLNVMCAAFSLSMQKNVG